MKFSGKIGFQEGDIETSPDVYVPNIVERPYTGDVLDNVLRYKSGDDQNDRLSVNRRIKIISDLYIRKNFIFIRYVVWNDIKLKVTSAILNYPYVTVEIGGVYNGKAAD